MLLNKKLHEEGQDRVFILPWNRLPMWFEYQRRESSITFWFRSKFPAISFGFFFPSVHIGSLNFTFQLTINGANSFYFRAHPNDVITTTQDGLVYIFNKTQTTFRDKVDEVLPENEWNCAVFSVHRRWRKPMSLNFIEVGVHIIKEKSCMYDVRFTDPLSQKECGYTLRDMGDCQTHAQLVQQQQTNSAPLEWQVGQGTELLSWPPPPSTFNDNVSGNSNSKRMSSTTTTLNVQDRGAVLNPVESLDDVYGSSNSDSDSEPQSLVGSDVEQPLDDAYNNSFSNKKELDIYDCKISEDFLRIVLHMSPCLQSLCLRSTEFSIVPKCIREFQFLRRLRLIDCWELEEIRGIPPNIEELFVVNCTSLSALTREMLLKQKLHEEGQDKMFILPEPAERLPMWFEYRRRDLSIAFWFRNKFPAISFGLFTSSDPLDQSTIRPRLTINGAKSFQLLAHDYESLDAFLEVGHILIFSKTQTTFRDQVGEALSENEWKRAVIDVYDDEPFNGNELDCVQVGIHIIKEKSCMDDIRFTDPLSQNQCDTLRDVGYSHEAHTRFVQQQTYSARFLEWQCDTVKFQENSKDMSSYTTKLNVQDLQEERNFRFWYKQEEQSLTSIDQHNLEGCGSFGVGNGKNPLTELLSAIKPEQLVILDLSRNCSDSIQVAELLKKKFENMRVLKFDYCKHITKIPNLSSAPKLEVLSFVCCDELTEIDESVGSLDKLKTLDAFGCGKLRSLPPLMLPSLKYLNLKLCSSLESFPEILGKMECVTRLFLSSYHIKKLPYSIHNLTGLQSVSLEDCGAVELPSGIMLPGVERLSFNRCKGLLLPNQDGGEKQVSSMPFSNTAFLRIYGCNISEEFLRIALPMFPRLQFLCLQGENFRILPECIGEFQFLRRLHLFACQKLEEIRGMPPNIEELRVSWCRSLSSSTREMLLNKKLYEEGQDKRFILPGKRLPVWFEYQRRESSITFWIRNKFPAISFGVLNPSPAITRFIRAKLTINGTKSFQLAQYHPRTEMGEDSIICIFSKTQPAFIDQVDEALSENEWNRAVFSAYYDVVRRNNDLVCAVEVGVHIIKERSSMDDIRFTDPLLSTFNDNLNGNSNSKQTSSTTTTLNVQGLQEEQNITSIDQHKLEGCESVDKACKNNANNAREEKGKNSLTELLSRTKNHGKDSDEEVVETTILPTSISEANPRSYESSSSFDKTPAKIQNTVTIQGVLTSSSKNHDKDSEVEVVETTTIPTAISEVRSCPSESSVHSENVDQPMNSLIEIQPPSPQPLDPLAELERVLLGSYDGSPESTSPTAASCSEIQSSEACIILQNLKSSLENPLEILIAEGEIKLQILDCLSKLVQLEDHIPISSQSFVAQVRDFYEDLIHSFPSIQQTLVDYSCLEETRSKFFENLKEAKVKQAQIDAEVSREKNQLEELAAEIADLEIKLKDVVEKRNELQLAIKNGEAEKNKILEDASVWLLESKQVVKKMRTSEHAYRDAQNSKARLEERLAKLKRAFAEVRSCPSESSIHSENVDQPMNSLIKIQPPSPQPLDPLAELERVLLGSYDGSAESTSPTAASCSEIQSSEVCIILQNLKPSLDNPLEILIAEGEIKLQILDCLSKLVQLEDHIPISSQTIVAQVRDFYEDLSHSFPSIQQTLEDYSCLEETRSKFLENLKQAKVKQARIEVKVSRGKNQLEELATEITDLELKLKAAVKKLNELQLAIKNGEAEKNKILEDASAWLMESKQVVKKLRSSEHAYRDAQNSKARLEGRLAKLKGAFAANKP